MGNAVHDSKSQVRYLKERLNMFMQVLDSIEPETTDLEDIDRLITMIDDLELKCEQFKKSDDNK
ncbi:SE1561 family protein [Priestia flexa]|uniref:SE1561 family protein n=1 Tax=Priestia flexa TaxID=86664 RepID=UPI0024C0B930|nr:SE1561 family protein [Priestia flexa]WHX79458.1 SE1561 family protein [Priestia flexa]